ncbi:MAG: FtsX-like permease family protein [Bacteroidetes bacterium]|jgi:putative ABC transport system permease protein|nr:FtsX-like permease family protein [Bacteroidota bacterium]
MNLFFIGWQNMKYRPASVVLSLILFALGIGLVSFLLQVERQVQQKFENNLAGIDLVVGAKGSPLQLVLSSMYHIDAPTGNISLGDARPFLRQGHPLIERAVPLSMGDSYSGFRIVGTTHEFLEMYNVDLSEVKLWQENFEVTVGVSVAKKLDLNIGDRFQSSHGFTDDLHSHDQDLIVVGVLPPTNTVLDQLILTAPGTYWHMHGDHSETKGRPEEPHGHNHSDHDHAHDHNHEHEGHNHQDGHDGHDHDAPRGAGEETESSSPSSLSYLLSQPDETAITSMLLQFKGRNFQALNLGRNINENTDLQAASPAIEINRLFSLLDSATAAIEALALAIVLVSAISIFLALYNKLRTRKFELAYMRVKGASRMQVFVLIILEGLFISIIGTLLGFILAYSGLVLLSSNLEANYNYSLSQLQFTSTELYILLAGLTVGLIAALIPAIQASKTDISLILNEGDKNA